MRSPRHRAHPSAVLLRALPRSASPRSTSLLAALSLAVCVSSPTGVRSSIAPTQTPELEWHGAASHAARLHHDAVPSRSRYVQNNLNAHLRCTRIAAKHGSSQAAQKLRAARYSPLAPTDYAYGAPRHVLRARARSSPADLARAPLPVLSSFPHPRARTCGATRRRTPCATRSQVQRSSAARRRTSG